MLFEDEDRFKRGVGKKKKEKTSIIYSVTRDAKKCDPSIGNVAVGAPFLETVS